MCDKEASLFPTDCDAIEEDALGLADKDMVEVSDDVGMPLDATGSNEPLDPLDDTDGNDTFADTNGTDILGDTDGNELFDVTSGKEPFDKPEPLSDCSLLLEVGKVMLLLPPVEGKLLLTLPMFVGMLVLDGFTLEITVFLLTSNDSIDFDDFGGSLLSILLSSFGSTSCICDFSSLLLATK